MQCGKNEKETCRRNMYRSKVRIVPNKYLRVLEGATCECLNHPLEQSWRDIGTDNEYINVKKVKPLDVNGWGERNYRRAATTARNAYEYSKNFRWIGSHGTGFKVVEFLKKNSRILDVLQQSTLDQSALLTMGLESSLSSLYVDEYRASGRSGPQRVGSGAYRNLCWWRLP